METYFPQTRNIFLYWIRTNNSGLTSPEIGGNWKISLSYKSFTQPAPLAVLRKKIFSWSWLVIILAIRNVISSEMSLETWEQTGSDSDSQSTLWCFVLFWKNCSVSSIIFQADFPSYQQHHQRGDGKRFKNTFSPHFKLKYLGWHSPSKCARHDWIKYFERFTIE